MLQKFKMTLRSFSFSYNNFSSLSGLICVGEVELSRNSQVFKITSHRSQLKSGALWHSLKQRIELGFQTTFGFKFRNGVFHAHGGNANGSVINQSMISVSHVHLDRPSMINQHMQDAAHEKVYQAAICFVIQTEREIARK